MKRAIPRAVPLFPGPLVFALCAALAGVSASSRAQGSDEGASIASKGNGSGAAACISCHGAHGEGNAAAGFPRLAGLSAPYIESQLALFADGKRQNAIMQPIAKALTEAQRVAVAHYFNGLKPTAPAIADQNVSPGQHGAWLATRGRWQDGLPACAQCHGPGGAGVGSVFPPLAGQPASYIAAQLHAFQQGTRPGGPLQLMSTVASKLSDADMTAVADYYSGQQAPQAAGSNGGKK